MKRGCMVIRGWDAPKSSEMLRAALIRHTMQLLG